jgi:small GTP-binding protein
MRQEDALDPPDDFKVVAVGDSGVGKTSIVLRYSTGGFSPTTQTIGAAYVKCVVGHDTGPITLNVWDTAGQEKFQSLIPLYLRSADACLIVFDATRSNNAQSLDKLYQYINDILGTNVYVVLCGNKYDLVTEDSDPEHIVDWASDRNMHYFKTSAKTGQGIDTLFYDIASALAARGTRVTETSRLPPDSQSDADKCC